MFHIETSDDTPKYCDGISRRSFVRIGVAGMASVTLADVLRAKEASVKSGHTKKDTAVILLWLDGGASHIDLWDMKPEAPSEYRGIWRPIPTNVPGTQFSELLSRTAKVADKFSIVRSLNHGRGDHFDASHLMLTGYGGPPESQTDKRGEYPSMGSIVSKVCGPRRQRLPAYVSVPNGMVLGMSPESGGYMGAHYLGQEYNPFETGGDPNKTDFRVKNFDLPPGQTLQRLEDRMRLRQRFDQLRRAADAPGAFDAVDHFQRQAFELVSGPAARKAFEISSEDPRVRDRYGRNSWGQSTLLARRLVEAGCTFVTVGFGYWDHHWGLEASMLHNVPRLDMAVSALFEDLSVRGLLDRVLVIVCGEFSRTPRMNNGRGKGKPGRDHWAAAISFILGGGGVQGGRIIGATDRLGERVTERPVGPGDLQATIYDVLGIDPRINLLNLSGRPVPVVPRGEVISELF